MSTRVTFVHVTGPSVLVKPALVQSIEADRQTDSAVHCHHHHRITTATNWTNQRILRNLDEGIVRAKTSRKQQYGKVVLGLVAEMGQMCLIVHSTLNTAASSNTRPFILAFCLA